MLSGNGRHRRPRQAPALLVAAGVTGSAIAIPLLGATAANAADGNTWDKVAECESGGSWSADTGNGYYGGLQMSQDDWDKYGGLHYAVSPDQASRSQQIAVAERILADQGTEHWATCALLSGLTANSGSVDVDTGVGGSGSQGNGQASSGDSDESSGLSDSSSGSDESGDSDGAAPSHGSSPSASPSSSADTGKKGEGENSAKSDKSASPDSKGSGDSQGTHSSVTESPKVDDSDNSWQTGSSWSLVDTGASSGGRHRGVSADEDADESAVSGQTATTSGRHATRGDSTYTVRSGDTLVSIADSLDVDGGWRALYAANEKSIGADPNDISAGQTLEVGGETGAK
ncbi:transglycosylase family protein [Streptomyces sp. NPDC054794]